LAACASFPTVQFDPSEKNLFINGVVFKIDFSQRELVKTGALIPWTSTPSGCQTGCGTSFVFSPNGLLVYAVRGKDVLVYVFDPTDGKFSAKGSFSSAVSVGGITAAE
jgi:hypothetical protein